MSRVQRDSVAGRAYLDVQNLARRTRRPTAELLHAYVLEGFLARLASSPEAGSLVLKGGVLLAAFAARRPTRDIDLAARDPPGEVDDVPALVRRTAAVEVDDGLDFDSAAARAATIRKEEAYAGCGSACRACWRRVPGGTLRIAGHPLAMVYAEKIVTVVERGLAPAGHAGSVDDVPGRLPSVGPVEVGGSAATWCAMWVPPRRSPRPIESRTGCWSQIGAHNRAVTMERLGA